MCERTRYQKQTFTVPNMRAVLKKASWGTRRIFRGIRCKKQASTVRKRYSVHKTGSCGTRRIFKGPQNSRLHRLWTASWGTRRIFRGTRCSKQASTVRKRYSVPKTGFCGTRRTFKGALNGILSHRTHFQRPAEQPTPQTVDSLLPHWTHFRGGRAKSSTCPPDASLEAAVPKAASCRTGHIFSARNGPRSLCSLRPRPPFPSSR